MSIPPEEKLPFEKIMDYILKGAKDALGHFTSQTKKWLIAYFVITSFCMTLDFIGFFKAVHHFGG
jgi:hypothetical protein